MKAFITLLLLFALASEYRAEDPIVKTRLGKVRGYNRATFNGRQFHAFEGIPYAQPPIGKLRFQVKNILLKNKIVFPNLNKANESEFNSVEFVIGRTLFIDSKLHYIHTFLSFVLPSTKFLRSTK